MEYTVKYIKTVVGGNYSYFDINGYNIKFATKSNKEVLWYLQNMENQLTNNLKFTSLQDLDSDIFRAIEYFAQAHPEMVKSYFLNAKEHVLIELDNLEVRRLVSISSIMKYICHISITENIKKEVDRIFNNISYNMLATKKMLNDLFHKRNQTIKLTINKSFSAPFGILTCIGRKYNSNSYVWSIDGEKNIIFKKSDKDIDELAEIIIDTLSEVHRKVKNKIIGELVDFTDVDDIKMINLYAKTHYELMRQYIEIIIQNNIKKGKLLFNAGCVKGFTPFDIIQTLSKNKNKKDLSEKRRNRNLDFISKLISELTNEYLIKQVDFHITNNNFDISENLWTYYYKQFGKLKYKTFDFSQLKNCSIKREFKLYVKHLIEIDSQTKNTLRKDKHLDYKLSWYSKIKSSLDYLIKEHSINCFADITPAMVADYLSDLEFNGLHGREKNSARSIETSINSIKLFSKWIYKNANLIKTSKPENNVFENVVFIGGHLVYQNQEDTEVIPEFIIKQIIKNLHFLKPEVYKRLLLCSLNTPRRFNELQLLNIESVQPIIINGKAANDKLGNPIYIISIIENKKQKNKQMVNNGLNYDKFIKNIPINHIVAREIKEQTKETKNLEIQINKHRTEQEKIHINKVFTLKNDAIKDGYSLVDNIVFVDAINRFIKDCNITDENGRYWSFSTRQTRTTGANLMVELGFNLDSIQKMLGHKHGTTTYKSYIKMSHLHIGESNTEFIHSQFDSLFSEVKDKFDEYEVLALFNKYCLDYNKIYYNRKLLGVCGLKLGEKCPKAEKGMKNNPNDELPCADCPSLYVGEACKAGWKSICENCKNDIDVLENFFKKNNISQKSAINVKEYKSAYVKYIKSQKVLEAISNLGG